MTMKLHEPTREISHLEVQSNIDELLVEELWNDLNKQVSRQEIARTMAQIAARFQDATVTTFVPIFIKRLTLEQLEERFKDKRKLTGDMK